MIWISKKPPEPFFGPDDFYHGMDVDEEIQNTNERIAEWHKSYDSLKLWDKIRLAFSLEGIMVK